jgi:hypothetical protein
LCGVCAFIFESRQEQFERMLQENPIPKSLLP